MVLFVESPVNQRFARTLQPGGKRCKNGLQLTLKEETLYQKLKTALESLYGRLAVSLNRAEAVARRALPAARIK